MQRKCKMKDKSNKVFCPICKNEIWDVAKDNKLHKCWECNTAFDIGKKV